MNGIINVNKSKGCTSRYVVSAVRRIFATRAAGHMGTLDPMGEGVLPVGIGKCTRLFDILLKKKKVYEASFKFGCETDTLDSEGKAVRFSDYIPDESVINAAAAKFIGKTEQLPPRYSAKNINGSRAYDLARRGEEFTLKPAMIEIYGLRIIEKIAFDEYLFEIACSSGTYIRSLCRDLAYAAGTVGTMTSIRRTVSGRFDIKDALTLEQIEQLGEKAVIPPEKVLDDLPRVDFPESCHKKISCGVAFAYDYPASVPFTVYCGGEFFGIGEVDADGIFKIKTYLKE